MGWMGWDGFVKLGVVREIGGRMDGWIGCVYVCYVCNVIGDDD